VQLIKRLLGEGCQIKIWDENVSLGRLIGSNRQYIEEVIPHIGSLLCSSLEEALDGSDVVILGTRVDKTQLDGMLKDRVVVDLVNLDKSRRPTGTNYEGICW
jgi:GDP-mannose 6-dehydrogenase